MGRKSDRKRLSEQRDRQQTYRDRMKREKRPGRDDVARMALHWLITSTQKKEGGEEQIRRMGNIIIKRLVEQGFDEKAAHEAYYLCVLKYTEDGWSFRRKTHLTAPYPVEEFLAQH